MIPPTLWPRLPPDAGKSEAYVQGRIKLTELIPPVAEAFLADRIGVGHALLIAKLPAAQQQAAFAAAFRSMWTSDGNQQVLIPVRELAAWIESNILLELASAPFSKQDEKLVPEAGACTNCPKRTGFNTLLFSDVRKDSCTDPVCFRAKLDAHVAQTLEAKPKLVQISSAWSSREGAPLGRNRYVELEVKRTKPNGSAAKLSPAQKPCEKMSEAIVMDGGKRGQIVKVCSDPNCRVHHPDRPSPQKQERERAEERKRIEQEKLAITIRHRILAAVLAKVAAPLKKSRLATGGAVRPRPSAQCPGADLGQAAQGRSRQEQPIARIAAGQAHCQLRRSRTLPDAAGDQLARFRLSARRQWPERSTAGVGQALPHRHRQDRKGGSAPDRSAAGEAAEPQADGEKERGRINQSQRNGGAPRLSAIILRQPALHIPTFREHLAGEMGDSANDPAYWERLAYRLLQTVQMLIKISPRKSVSV